MPKGKSKIKTVNHGPYIREESLFNSIVATRNNIKPHPPEAGRPWFSPG